MTDPTVPVLAILFGVVVIGVIIVSVYLYIYFKRENRFPCQKVTGTPYRDPVAQYYEINDVKAETPQNSANVYAVVEEVPPKVLMRNKDKEEYDHLGEKLKFPAVRYDTTASAVQFLTPSSPVQGEIVYGYDRLASEPDPKMPSNKYEVVGPVGNVPRSPTNLTDANPNYNCLLVARPQTVLKSEYDKPDVQGAETDPQKVSTHAKETSSGGTVHETQTVKSVSSDILDDSYQSWDEFDDAEEYLTEGPDSGEQIYRLASAIDSKRHHTIDNSFNPHGEETRHNKVLPVGPKSRSKSLPKKPEINAKSSNNYCLATLPLKTPTSPEKTNLKPKFAQMKNLIKHFENSREKTDLPECKKVIALQVNNKDGEVTDESSTYENAEMKKFNIGNSAASTNEQNNPVSFGREDIVEELNPRKHATSKKPSIIPRRTLSNKKREK